MNKGRAAVIASVCTGLLGASAACSAVLGIKDFTAGDGGASSSKDATTDHGSSGGDDGSTSSNDGGIHLTCADEDGGAGAVGCACNPQVTPTGCNGYGQGERLICEGSGTSGTWTASNSCNGGSNCDTRPGNLQGTCATIDPNCMSASPGQQICLGSSVIQCGPDLISETPVTTCSNACFDGGCTGICTPGATQCVGNGAQTCSAMGQWSATTSCSEQCADGGCTKFPSCQPATPGADTSCGPGEDGGPGTTDCCASYEVTGSTMNFYRSYDGVSAGDTSQGAPATVSSLRLDGYEITVGRFRNFVAAVDQGWLPTAGSGKHTHLNSGSGLAGVGADAGSFEPGWSTSWSSGIATSASGWNTNLACDGNATWTSSTGANENDPVTCIDWYEAYAFCIWDGGFLPSEAEWNYAASGGTEQRVYPWPNPAPADDASAPANVSCAFANYSACATGGANAVGSDSPMGDGKYAQSDLAGNVWEWALDDYATYVYPCNDCANVGSGTSRVTRGGSFNLVASALLASYRGNNAPTTRDGSIGARCARVP